MNGSPAICWENRVQRAQSTQRSRSSSTCELIAIGLGKVRLTSWKRETALPVLIAWFCSGHSPPLSQTGQSSGWLISNSSMMPRCAFSATAEVTLVRTTMPSVQVVVQEVSGLRWPSTSTMHCRQAPTGSSNGWSQNRGIWMPASSAARITSVPLGTWTATLSMVTVIRSAGAGAGTEAAPAGIPVAGRGADPGPVSYTHLRAHETPEHLVCRLLLEKQKNPHHPQANPQLKLNTQ